MLLTSFHLIVEQIQVVILVILQQIEHLFLVNVLVTLAIMILESQHVGHGLPLSSFIIELSEISKKNLSDIDAASKCSVAVGRPSNA